MAMEDTLFIDIYRWISCWNLKQPFLVNFQLPRLITGGYLSMSFFWSFFTSSQDVVQSYNVLLAKSSSICSINCVFLPWLSLQVGSSNRIDISSNHDELTREMPVKSPLKSPLKYIEITIEIVPIGIPANPIYQGSPSVHAPRWRQWALVNWGHLPALRNVGKVCAIVYA